MFYLLIAVAALCFIAHAALLFTSFPRGRFHSARYFYSHLTLWVTGVLLFMLTVLYAGRGESYFLDYFDTTFAKCMILLVTVLLSLVAHTIVKKWVLPSMKS